MEYITFHTLHICEGYALNHCTIAATASDWNVPIYTVAVAVDVGDDGAITDAAIDAKRHRYCLPLPLPAAIASAFAAYSCSFRVSSIHFDKCIHTWYRLLPYYCLLFTCRCCGLHFTPQWNKHTAHISLMMLLIST